MISAKEFLSWLSELFWKLYFWTDNIYPFSDIKVSLFELFASTFVLFVIWTLICGMTGFTAEEEEEAIKLGYMDDTDDFDFDDDFYYDD